MLLSANALKDHRSVFTFEDTFTLKPGGLGVRTCYFVFSSHLMSRPYLPSFQRWCTHICRSTFLAQGTGSCLWNKTKKDEATSSRKLETFNFLVEKDYVFCSVSDIILLFISFSLSLWKLMFPIWHILNTLWNKKLDTVAVSFNVMYCVCYAKTLNWFWSLF